MPGFNQKGPMSEGPMTGRGMGRCAAPTQDTARDWDAPGYGRGRTMGRRRCQQQIRRGADVPERTQVSLQLQPAGVATLTEKAHQLELELETIKNQLKQMGQ